MYSDMKMQVGQKDELYAMMKLPQYASHTYVCTMPHILNEMY